MAQHLVIVQLKAASPEAATKHIEKAIPKATVLPAISQNSLVALQLRELFDDFDEDAAMGLLDWIDNQEPDGEDGDIAVAREQRFMRRVIQTIRELKKNAA